jgi:glycosyltransferase involved in cell wall biosynthesis
MKKIIGVNAVGYNHLRNIIDIPLQSYEIKRVKEVFAAINWAYFKWKNQNDLYYLNSFYDANFYREISIFHFFNTISFGKTPWVTTFETFLPRWGERPSAKIEQGLKVIAQSPCKKLIGFSACSASIIEQYLAEKFPQFSEAIMPKVTFQLPPQKPLIGGYEEKELPADSFIFTFVGKDFFRKGGREVVKAMIHLRQKNYPVVLNIISNLQTDNFATFTTTQDVADIQTLLNQHKDFIHVYSSLPNTEVLKMMRNSHVSFLTTYQDTFGYSVLEAQAAATPVISTDIRALPEINNDSVGWVIPVPKNNWGNGILETPENRNRFHSLILDNLIAILESMMARPEMIREKGIQSLQRIRQYHNPIDVASQREQLYDNIIAGK